MRYFGLNLKDFKCVQLKVNEYCYELMKHENLKNTLVSFIKKLISILILP